MSDISDTAKPTSPAASWALLCQAFEDIRRGAAKHGLTDRFRALETDTARGAGRLADWLALRQELRDREADQEGYGKHPLGGDLPRVLDWYGIADEAAAVYVCPNSQRCARREAAMYGAAPPCDLLGLDMIRQDGG